MLSESVVVSTLKEVQKKYPIAFEKCHKETFPGSHVFVPEAHDFIILGGRELNKLDPTVGMNGKRGNIHDPSMDAIWNDGRVVDVVNRAGAPDASIGYNDVTSAGPGAFVNPFDHETVGNYQTHTTLLGASLFPMVSGYQKYPSTILHFINEYKEMHVDYVRWFFTVGGKEFSGSDPWLDIGAFFSDSSHAFWVRETFKILRAHKLKSHVVLCGTHEQYVEFGNAIIDGFISCVNGYLDDVILLEMANEFDVNDFSTSEIRNMARYARSRLPAGFPITLSSPGTCHDPASTEDEVREQIDKMYGGDSGANCFTMHNSRPDPVWNPESIRSILSPSIDVWDSEARGPNASAGGNVDDPNILGGDYQTAIRGNAKGKVFHSQPGVWIGHCNGFPDENEYKLLTDIPNWPEIKRVHKEIRETGNFEGGDTGGGTDVLNPYPDENTFWKDFSKKVADTYKEAGRTDVEQILKLDPAMFIHWTRTTYDGTQAMTPEKSAEKHLKDLRVMLGLDSPETAEVKSQESKPSHYRY